MEAHSNKKAYVAIKNMIHLMVFLHLFSKAKGSSNPHPSTSSGQSTNIESSSRTMHRNVLSQSIFIMHPISKQRVKEVSEKYKLSSDEKEERIRNIQCIELTIKKTLIREFLLTYSGGNIFKKIILFGIGNAQRDFYLHCINAYILEKRMKPYKRKLKDIFISFHNQVGSFTRITNEEYTNSCIEKLKEISWYDNMFRTIRTSGGIENKNIEIYREDYMQLFNELDNLCKRELIDLTPLELGIPKYFYDSLENDTKIDRHIIDYMQNNPKLHSIQENYNKINSLLDKVDDLYCADTLKKKVKVAIFTKLLRKLLEISPRSEYINNRVDPNECYRIIVKCFDRLNIINNLLIVLDILNYDITIY